MFRGLKDLIDFSVLANGEEIGVIDDFYIDTDTWAVRYMVANTGGWLDGRRAIFLINALGPIDETLETVTIDVDKDRIQDSPDIMAGRQISRQQEVELLTYYDWPFYWTPGETQGLGPGGLSSLPMIELEEEIQRKRAEQGEPIQTSLISAQALLDSSILARDDETGEVDDLVVNTEDWNILYLVVDLSTVLQGKKVLLSPSWIEQVDPDKEQIVVDLKSETIRESPEITSISELDEAFEQKLAQYYQR